MAGVKGRSGGARPGSGPKPTIMLLQADSDDPAEFLRQVMREKTADGRLRVRAAAELAKIEKTAAPGRLGKKGATTESAKEVSAGGKFAPGGAPKLVVSNKSP